MTLLLAFVVAGHLAVAGVASVGSLLVAGLRLDRRLRQDPPDTALRRLAIWATAAVVLAALLGFLAGVLRLASGDHAYEAMLRRFTGGAYALVAVEWLFTLACYAAWLAVWDRWRDKPWRHAAVAVVGATNLLYHFPPLMIVQNLLAEDPALVESAVVSRGVLVELMWSPRVLAPTLHVWGASTVVAAAAAVWLVRDQPGSAATTSLVRRTATLGLVATVLQFATGLATLLVLSPAEASHVTGGGLLATACLVTGVLLAVWLLVAWAELLLAAEAPRVAGRLTALVLGTMLLMSLASRW